MNSKTALVTGATSGIGKAIALELARKGWQISFCGRRQKNIDAVKKSISEIGGEVLGVEADLTKPEDLRRFFAESRERFGGIDALINNAGIGYASSFLEGDPDQWKQMIDLNIFALCLCTQEALRWMRENDSGHIIHVSSMSAHRVPGTGVYSATKHAVRALGESLRLELRGLDSKIRVSMVSPGFVETDFFETYTGSKEKAKATYSAQKCLEAADIARTVAFCLESPPHMQIHDILVRPTEQKS